MNLGTWRTPLAVFGLLLVAAVLGWGVYSDERILAGGKVVRLALAPVDPRSLLQGDYMALNYALAEQLRQAKTREDGYLVLQVDAQRVGHFARTLPTLADAALASDELALRYRVRNGRVQLATNAFFFQEGHEPRFREARYGEFRVGENGEPRLVALLDARFAILGNNRF